VTESNHINSLGIKVGGMRSWRDAGVPEARFRAAVRDGDLVRVRRGVYASRELADKARDQPAAGHALQAAAALCGQSARGAVASHQSAALIHGISLLRAPDRDIVWLTRPPGRYRAECRGIRYRSAALPVSHVTVRYGIPLTTGARTVVDLARSRPYLDAVTAADSALYARITTRAELGRVLADCAGWAGIHRARRVVEFSDGLAESALESAARVIFALRGLPPPRLQTDIVDDAFRLIGRADFLWERYRTIAEADGMAKYADPRRARTQVVRDIRLREAGYKVVHFTWADIFGDPARVIARIRTAFAASTAY
jgi:predicted transcriptional regulator of viral defense system